MTSLDRAGSKSADARDTPVMIVICGIASCVSIQKEDRLAEEDKLASIKST